jgi:hypothetical protein
MKIDYKENASDFEKFLSDAFRKPTTPIAPVKPTTPATVPTAAATTQPIAGGRQGAFVAQFDALIEANKRQVTR